MYMKSYHESHPDQVSQGQEDEQVKARVLEVDAGDGREEEDGQPVIGFLCCWWWWVSVGLGG